MNLYLEQLKVEAALRSENMKLEYRKKNKPSEINILDYTVITALEKQIAKEPTHEASLQKCCTCPSCKNVIDKFEQFGESKVRVKYNYCHFCGQKIKW